MITVIIASAGSWFGSLAPDLRILFAVGIFICATAGVATARKHIVERHLLRRVLPDPPRLALDIIVEPGESWHEDKWLQISNYGPGSAFDIQIDSMRNGPFECTFEPIHALSEGEKRWLRTRTWRVLDDGRRGFFESAHEFVWMLEHDRPKNQSVIKKQIVIRFRDHMRREHEIVEFVVNDTKELHFYVASKESGG